MKFDLNVLSEKERNDIIEMINEHKRLTQVLENRQSFVKSVFRYRNDADSLIQDICHELLHFSSLRDDQKLASINELLESLHLKLDKLDNLEIDFNTMRTFLC